MSGLNRPTVVRFSPDGRIFVAEKSGIIKVFASLTATMPTIFADLTSNVDNYRDRALSIWSKNIAAGHVNGACGPNDSVSRGRMAKVPRRLTG